MTQHESQWAGWNWTEGCSTCETSSAMGFGTQTSLLSSPEGQWRGGGGGGGIDFPLFFWPAQHTPSPVKGPPAVDNFQEPDKPLEQRNFTSHYELYLMARHLI